MKKKWKGLLIASAVILLTMGCGMKGGPSGLAPAISQPSEAANITFYRDASLVGWFASIVVKIDGREVLRVARNEAHTLTVDPGQYLIVYTMGFNHCRQVVYVRPRENVRVRLSPSCT